MSTTLAVTLKDEQAPRHVTFTGLRASSSFACKEYEISVDRSRVAPEDWDIARDLHQRFIEEPSPFDRIGLGVTIVHEGADGTYILLLDQRIHVRNASTDGAFVPAAEELAPCVWERAIYGHENTAYQHTTRLGRRNAGRRT